MAEAKIFGASTLNTEQTNSHVGIYYFMVIIIDGLLTYDNIYFSLYTINIKLATVFLSILIYISLINSLMKKYR